MHSSLSLSSFLSLKKLSLSLSRSSSSSFKPSLSHQLSTMSLTSLKAHAFASNPIRARTPKASDPYSPTSALETIKSHLLSNTHLPISPKFKVLSFRKGRPLAFTSTTDNGNDNDNDGGGGLSGSVVPKWHLGWISLDYCKALLDGSGESLSVNSLVYLGSSCEDDEVYWGVDVSDRDTLVVELGTKQFCFVELRTLMVATDWSDSRAMGDLAIAGQGRSLIEWHSVSRFCGHCGEQTIPLEGGRRKQCSSESCKSRIYPRVDPVVIMLVIDKENDRALLSRQSRFVPRMWSCLAGFMEPGESLEEAVRRETWEETGIEVGEVIYHSSQPWPVGPSSIPCQLMVGFFAIAKSLEIEVDKTELEDAQWHSREDVKKALTFAEYRKAQRTAAVKVDQMCKGVQKGQNLSADFNVESGELAPMFIPGPFAIAHHLISSWVNQDQFNGVENRFGQLSSSLSSL